MTDSPRRDEIDPLLLAAWLDHSLNAEETALVEAVLASDPLALDAVLAARGALALPEMPTKATMAAMATLLSSQTVAKQRPAFNPFRAAFAATVLLAVAAGGFGLGRGFEGLQNDYVLARADHVLEGYLSFSAEVRR